MFLPTSKCWKCIAITLMCIFLLTGQETIGWKAVETLEHQAQAYQKEGDCALYSDRPTLFATLQPGEFAIVYPEDPHAPVIGEGKIRKLIGKVKL